MPPGRPVGELLLPHVRAAPACVQQRGRNGGGTGGALDGRGGRRKQRGVEAGAACGVDSGRASRAAFVRAVAGGAAFAVLDGGCCCVGGDALHAQTTAGVDHDGRRRTYRPGDGAARGVFGHGKDFDEPWQAVVAQTSQQWQSMSPDAQTAATLKWFAGWLLSAEGRAGSVLGGLMLLEVALLVFAAAGGAIGARIMARSRRPEA